MCASITVFWLNNIYYISIPFYFGTTPFCICRGGFLVVGFTTTHCFFLLYLYLRFFFLLYVGSYCFLFWFSLLCPCLISLLPTKIKSSFYIICKWSVTQSQSLGTILGLFTLLLVYCELLLYPSSDYSLHSSTYLLLLTKLIPSRISLYRSSSLIPSPCYYLQTFPNYYS